MADLITFGYKPIELVGKIDGGFPVQFDAKGCRPLVVLNEAQLRDFPVEIGQSAECQKIAKDEAEIQQNKKRPDG